MHTPTYRQLEAELKRAQASERTSLDVVRRVQSEKMGMGREISRLQQQLGAQELQNERERSAGARLASCSSRLPQPRRGSCVPSVLSHPLAWTYMDFSERVHTSFTHVHKAYTCLT